MLTRYLPEVARREAAPVASAVREHPPVAKRPSKVDNHTKGRIEFHVNFPLAAFQGPFDAPSTPKRKSRADEVNDLTPLVRRTPRAAAASRSSPAVTPPAAPAVNDFEARQRASRALNANMRQRLQRQAITPQQIAPLTPEERALQQVAHQVCRIPGGPSHPREDGWHEASEVARLSLDIARTPDAAARRGIETAGGMGRFDRPAVFMPGPSILPPTGPPSLQLATQAIAPALAEWTSPESDEEVDSGLAAFPDPQSPIGSGSRGSSPAMSTAQAPGSRSSTISPPGLQGPSPGSPVWSASRAGSPSGPSPSNLAPTPAGPPAPSRPRSASPPSWDLTGLGDLGDLHTDLPSSARNPFDSPAPVPRAAIEPLFSSTVRHQLPSDRSGGPGAAFQGTGSPGFAHGPPRQSGVGRSLNLAKAILTTDAPPDAADKDGKKKKKK